MKKLLLVMLVPVLVLGVIGCGDTWVDDTETDAFVQGNWAGVDNDDVGILNPLNYEIAISAGQLTIMYADLVIPVRTEFAYLTGNRFLMASNAFVTDAAGVRGATTDGFFENAGARSDFAFEDITATKVLAGYITLFRFEDNLEIGDLNVIVALDETDMANNEFHITKFAEAEEAWYIRSVPIPPVGAYLVPTAPVAP